MIAPSMARSSLSHVGMEMFTAATPLRHVGAERFLTAEANALGRLPLLFFVCHTCRVDPQYSCQGSVTICADALGKLLLNRSGYVPSRTAAPLSNSGSRPVGDPVLCLHWHPIHISHGTFLGATAESIHESGYAEDQCHHPQPTRQRRKGFYTFPSLPFPSIPFRRERSLNVLRSL